jgi:hypothetical protein
MELDDLKSRNLTRNTLIELTRLDKMYSKRTDPLYFLRLVEESPDLLKADDKEPPYVEFAGHKDKNGCFMDYQAYGLDEILYLFVHGQSKIS